MSPCATCKHVHTGKFNHPRGIACQKSTRFVIVSDENDRLQVLKFSEWPTPSLTYVSTFGRSSTTLPPNEKHNSDGGRSDALGFFRRPAGSCVCVCCCSIWFSCSSPFNLFLYCKFLFEFHVMNFFMFAIIFFLISSLVVSHILTISCVLYIFLLCCLLHVYHDTLQQA